MPTQQQTAQQVMASERTDRRARTRTDALAARGELIGYAMIWAALAAFLWSRITAVDQFYLDEWIYVHGSEYIWDHLPGGLIGGIPLWDRGPQRLYSTLMAPLWGPFGTSTAFTLSHLLNVLLLSSAVAPAALFARRVIERPALRVLGVVLAVAVPWLAIGTHLLAENLAFPLSLWALYAIVRAAEAPTLRTQLPALALIAATTLCRLNLASLFAVLLAAVLAAEIRDRLSHRPEPFATWLRRAVRRQWPIVVVAALGLVAAVAFVLGGSSAFGRYGVVDGDRIVARLFGAEADTTRRIMLTFARSLAVGTFVMPFVLGLSVALAGSAGRLGGRRLVPSVVALSALIVTVVAVSVYTVSDQPEERYVFFVCAPIGILAAASLEHLGALRRWIAGAGALTIWLLLAGLPFPGVNAGNFFAAPAGATWTRVVDHRLRSLEADLLGWLFIPATGWLLIALVIGALVVWIGAAAPRPRLRAGVVAAGLAVCVVAQVAMLAYALEQEIHGTTDAPGGLALSDDRANDRQKWIDAALPDDATAAVLPGSVSLAPDGLGESTTFWSKDVDATVAMPWTGSPVPVPPGGGVVSTELGPDGLATWQGAPPEWLVAQRDDPRVQFAGRVGGASPSYPLVALELTGAPSAAWTATGVDAGGGVPPGPPATLRLDAAQVPGVRSVELAFSSPAGDARPTRWRVRRGDRTVARGSVPAGTAGTATLRVPAGTGDEPIAWQLRVKGPLRLDAARLGT